MDRFITPSAFDPLDAYVVAITGNTIIGNISFHPVGDQPAIEINNLLVAQDYRSLGLGKLLVKRLEDEACQTSVGTIYTAPQPAVQPFLAKAGFMFNEIFGYKEL